MSKICFFNTAMAWGGGEKWHYDMASYLTSQGISALFICKKNSALHKKLKISDIPFYLINISNTSFLNPFKLFKLRKIFQNNDIDTIVLNLSQDLKSGGISAKLANVNRIIYRRGSAIPVRNTFLNKLIFKMIVDEILVNSIETKKCILKENSKIFPEQFIKVIYNGIDCQKFIESEHKNLYKRKNNEVVLTNLGRLEQQKNQTFLIEIAAELNRRNINFHMLIGGKGRLQKNLEKKIKKLKLNDKIDLLGFIKNPKNLYESGDIFLLSSFWEGFGYVIAEAGICKKPVIAFDISSNPEIIINGKTGFLVEKNSVQKFCDKIEFFCENKKEIKNIGNNAFNHIQNYFDIFKLKKTVLKYLVERNRKKITAIITTFNVENEISNCLDSIKWVDEIIIVDSFSTDCTEKICEKYGAKIFKRKYKYAAEQKNWILKKIKNPWVIILDSDEILEPESKNEILKILNTRPKFTAYWIKRKNYFLGKKINFSGWQNDKVVRFFNKNFHKYENKMVHAEIEKKTQFGVLSSKIIHHTSTDINIYSKKIRRYAKYASIEHINENKKINWFHLYIKPFHKFIYNFIFRGGFLDGKNGFIICYYKFLESFLKAKFVLKDGKTNK